MCWNRVSILTRAMVVAGLVSVGSMRAQGPELALNDDPTTSGFGGLPVRIIEPSSILHLTIVGPVGDTALLFGGPKLEPGISIGSGRPIHIGKPYSDFTFVLGNPAGVVLLDDNVPGGIGRHQISEVVPAAFAGLQLALQVALVHYPSTPTQPITIELSNPIELLVPAGSPGAAASIEVDLDSFTVEETDEGGVLTVGAIVRDAAGRVILPTPSFTVSTTAPSATVPGPNQLSVPTQGGYDVAVALTTGGLSDSTPYRVVPELISGSFVAQLNVMADLDDLVADGFRYYGLGNTAQFNNALAALTNGLLPGNISDLFNVDIFLPTCGGYPTVSQLIGNGSFPANPDDALLPTIVASLQTALNDAQAFQSAIPPGTMMTQAQLSQFEGLVETVEAQVQLYKSKSFSKRALWQHMGALQPLLNNVLPDTLTQTLGGIKEAFQALQTATDYGKKLSNAWKKHRLGGLALEIYRPMLEEIASLGGQMLFHNLVSYALNGIATLGLCDVCSINTALGCSGVQENAAVELAGSGFGLDSQCHRVLVMTASSTVAPVQGALTGHDTICDYFEAITELKALFSNYFFVFAPDQVSYFPTSFCTVEPVLVVNSWPLMNTNPFGLPQIITVAVLRLDAGISNAFQSSQW